MISYCYEMGGILTKIFRPASFSFLYAENFRRRLGPHPNTINPLVKDRKNHADKTRLVSH